jgi:hypothetical protein
MVECPFLANASRRDVCHPAQLETSSKLRPRSLAQKSGLPLTGDAA